MDRIGKTAVILPPAGDDWSHAALRVAGVPVVSRILISAERAGVHRVIICAGEAAPRLQALVAERPPRSRVQWIGTAPAELTQALRENGSSPCFFIRGSAVLNPAVFTELRVAFHPGATLVVPAGQGPDAPVALRTPDIAPDPQKPPAQVPLSGAAVCLDLTTTLAEAAAEALYRVLGKSTDSWVIRRSRRLLFPVMRALVETSLTPNHLTLVGFLIGLGAIACLWQGEYRWTVAGAALFVVAYLIDLMDGMLARLKLQESRWGGVMDYALDNVVHVGIFAAIIRAVYLKRPEGTVLTLGLLLLVGAVISGCLVAAHMMQPRRPVNRLLAQVMHRDFSLIVLLAAIADRLVWFLWAAAIGINLFWPAVLFLLLREGKGPSRRHVERPGLSGAPLRKG